MPFPFSFMFSAPGVTNPFTPVISTNPAPARPIPIMPRSPVKSTILSKHQEAFGYCPPHFASPQPLSKKRGWVPSSVEPSIATTIPTSMSGYLDSPSKYRGMASQQEEDSDFEDAISDLPPPKRRRTLAGSIVSTALSAALIGTAVGVTVYRLWANRGKPEQLPPPPYEQGGWVPPTPEPTSAPVTSSATKPRKQRYVAGKRTAPKHRKSYNRLSIASALVPASAPVEFSPPRPTIPPEFQFGSPDPADVSGEDDEQMDWIGDKLSQLIEEGKRALGKEVVVASEVQEDEVDDGSGEWVEEEESSKGSRTSRSGSFRRSKRPRALTVSSPPPSYTPPATTPRRNRFDPDLSRRNSFTNSSQAGSRGTSADSDSQTLFRSNHKEDEAEWQTPELRQSMERARQMYLQRSHAS